MTEAATAAGIETGTIKTAIPEISSPGMTKEIHPARRLLTPREIS